MIATATKLGGWLYDYLLERRFAPNETFTRRPYSATHPCSERCVCLASNFGEDTILGYMNVSVVVQKIAKIV
jgi:hypothetical protein